MQQLTQRPARTRAWWHVRFALACGVIACVCACSSETCPAGQVRSNGTGACVDDNAHASAGHAAINTQVFSISSNDVADSGAPHDDDAG
jgi:hypothetical protein